MLKAECPSCGYARPVTQVFIGLFQCVACKAVFNSFGKIREKGNRAWRSYVDCKEEPTT